MLQENCKNERRRLESCEQNHLSSFSLTPSFVNAVSSINCEIMFVAVCTYPLIHACSLDEQSTRPSCCLSSRTSPALRISVSPSPNLYVFCFSVLKKIMKAALTQPKNEVFTTKNSPKNPARTIEATHEVNEMHFSQSF